jgi:formate C-acetyltransferase
MCFDKKLCTTRELYDAVMANWEGFDALRARVLKEVPHFGNGDPYADEEMKWCCDTYYEICSQLHTSRAKVYKAGLYGSSDHINQGHLTWGTPDGRRYPEPLADAASPAQGRDKEGPLTVLRSACCYDHTHYMGGIALNLRMHPTVLSDDPGVEKLRAATQAYFDYGGMEVQYNVVDTETLRQAQERPADYRDLVVRIAGYSAYFIELSHDQQNDLISRTENNL